MNYRHAYHAGNFADVMKHAVLAAVIDLMKRKPTPFRFIDTHAGVGVYDLSGDQATKTGEWRQGIARVLAAERPAEADDALAPYLGVVAEVGGGDLRHYPGSPEVARRLLRADDRIVLNELHPVDAAELAARYAGDKRVKVLSLDGWMALKSLLPPKERRGVVLVDPPFEEPGEFRRLLAALQAAHRRFATGVVLLWYPIKDRAAVAAFQAEVVASGLARLLSVELSVRSPKPVQELSGAGLVILNPPFGLEPRLEAMMPFLARAMALEGAGEHRLAWLAGEREARQE